MKSLKAFTMSEALIVLGIIAVLATLSVLAVQNAKPDPEIVMFRKAYKTTQDIALNLYYDKELYENSTEPIFTSDLNNNPIPENTFGFFDNATTAKFSKYFVERLNPLSSFLANNVYSVTTADGIAWEVYDNFANYNASTNPNPKAYITIYLNGKEANSCSYNVSSCTRPNKFIFEITHSARVTPLVSTESNAKIDPIACSYLRYSKVNKFNKIPKTLDKNSCFKY